MRSALTVEGVFIDPEIKDAYFACDVEKCKGACCFMSGPYGAPITEEEISAIEEVLPKIKKYLPQKSVELIEKKGFYEQEDIGYFTRCVDNRECVFVYWEDGVARCSFERAYLNGEINFRKPVSCHLFPLRSYGLRTYLGFDVLRYVKIPECKPAVKRGEREGIKLYVFAKDALVRWFGEEWYEKFAQRINGSKTGR